MIDLISSQQSGDEPPVAPFSKLKTLTGVICAPHGRATAAFEQSNGSRRGVGNSW